MTANTFFRGIVTAGILILGLWNISAAQYQYNEEPVLNIIDQIQQNSSFRFLYRDALVANIELSFSSDEQRLLADFRRALLSHDLDLKVDSARNQAIIYQAKKEESPKKEITIKGQVVDASTGERLPYATIMWEQDNSVKGVSSNEGGSFTINRKFDRQTVDIKCSYVGYATKIITLDLSDLNNMHELTFRLKAERIDGNEIVATGTNYYNDVDQQVSELVDIGAFSAMGETNTMRALQVLPSVSLSPAMSGGLHVRGSPHDGFRVLIDGITIYNQSHLFGLVDSFNADILKRSGFFYDIAPVQFQAPPGGTLSLLTKTGPLNRISGTGGLSNSSFRLSLEGPLKKGKSSWLIAGRTSYMNTVDWLNNSALIKWGLDIDRDRQVLNDGLFDIESLLVRPGETDASFYDLHTKIYFEGNKGNRLILSGYFGGDDTRQNAERKYRTFSSTDNNFEFRPISTTNDWQNGAASAQYQHWLTENIYANSTIGVSIYHTEFSKDDFTYVRLEPSLQAFVFPFENKSVLNEIKFDQRLEFNTSPWLLTAGVSYNYFLGEYFEASFDRPGYFDSQSSHKIDAYGQIDFSGLDILDLFTGTRVHYYSSGDYLKWSPRIKLKLFPESTLAIGGGFSRNHQFMNTISLSNTITSDVWILTGKDQPPTSVNYYSAGVYFSPFDGLYAQAEGYIKEFEHVRLHEINTFSLSNTYNSNPWFINNNGLGQGVEFLIRNEFGFATLTQTFAISEVMLVNPDINHGDPFLADWDRTYRYAASLETRPISNLTLYLSWMYATGTPNKLAVFGPQNKERVSDYQRADISAEYNQQFQTGHLSMSLSFFNVLDRRNSWYRELAIVIDENTSRNRLRTLPVDVYDIGFQPSFNISVAF